MRQVLSWCGGFPEYRRLCDEEAAGGYQGFILRAHSDQGQTPIDEPHHH